MILIPITTLAGLDQFYLLIAMVGLFQILLSDCDQLVNGFTHCSGSTLDLVCTNVSSVVNVSLI